MFGNSELLLSWSLIMSTKTLVRACMDWSFLPRTKMSVWLTVSKPFPSEVYSLFWVKYCSRGDSPGLLHGRAGGPETTPSGRGKDLGRLWRGVAASLSADSVPD